MKCAAEAANGGYGHVPVLAPRMSWARRSDGRGLGYCLVLVVVLIAVAVAGVAVCAAKGKG